MFYLSRALNEVKAAHEVGMQAILCDRDLKASQAWRQYGHHQELEEVFLD
jgi:methionine salvage enolase-phosphatase E1